MDGIMNAAAAIIGIASFVRSFIDLKAFAAEREHLRHEGHPVELPLIIERPQNLFLAPDFHPIAHQQFASLCFHLLIPLPANL
jgi:hypothetical protein